MIIPNKHSGYQAGIRRYYMGGGGGGLGSIFSSTSNAAPNADPYTSANRPNYVPVGANGQFNQPIFQPKYENYSMNNPMSVSQYGTSGGNYFLQNPDVQQSFTQTTNPGSPDQFDQLHYNNFGRNEGRTSPGASMYPQMQNTPFNPYTNSSGGGFGGGGFGGGYGGFMPQQQMYQPQQQQMQSLPVQPAQTNYGPSRAIVGRSSQMRGTPNVMRRAEGGIASLTSSIE